MKVCSSSRLDRTVGSVVESTDQCDPAERIPADIAHVEEYRSEHWESAKRDPAHPRVLRVCRKFEAEVG